MTAPTQVRRPWRTTVRTVAQALLALAVMAPVLVAATGLHTAQLPWLAGVLAVAAGVTRVMALPQVEDFLRAYLPWLAAAPPADDWGPPSEGRHRGEGGTVDTSGVIWVACLGFVLLLIALVYAR